MDLKQQKLRDFWELLISLPLIHQIPSLLVVPLQNELAKKAVSDLAAVFGTKYTYGSIANTICECPSLHLPANPSGMGSHVSSSPCRHGRRHHHRLGLRQRGEIFLQLGAEGLGALRIPPAQLPDRPHRHRDVAGAPGHHGPRPGASILTPALPTAFPPLNKSSWRFSAFRHPHFFHAKLKKKKKRWKRTPSPAGVDFPLVILVQAPHSLALTASMGGDGVFLGDQPQICGVLSSCVSSSFPARRGMGTLRAIAGCKVLPGICCLFLAPGTVVTCSDICPGPSFTPLPSAKFQISIHFPHHCGSGIQLTE